MIQIMLLAKFEVYLCFTINNFYMKGMHCNVYINQKDAQILVNTLYFFVKWLYMFWTIISPSSRATFSKLYSAIGTVVQVRLYQLHCTAY